MLVCVALTAGLPDYCAQSCQIIMNIYRLELPDYVHQPPITASNSTCLPHPVPCQGDRRATGMVFHARNAHNCAAVLFLLAIQSRWLKRHPFQDAVDVVTDVSGVLREQGFRKIGMQG